MTVLYGLLFFLWVGEPTAHAVTRDLEVCLEFRKNFDDAKGGDWWTDNSTNAMGRGLLIEVNDDTATNKYGRAGETTGCHTFEVEVSLPLYDVTVKVVGDAVVSGVQIQSYEDEPWDPLNGTGTRGEDLADETRVSAVWPLVQVGSDPTTVTKYLPEEGPWMHLAVATMVFRRSDFNITDPVSRDCCTNDNHPGPGETGDTGDPGYDEDGTCPIPDYANVDPPVRLHHRPNSLPGGCGGSTVNQKDGVAIDPGHPATALKVDGCPKFVVAHELGHVIEMMRTGARTRKNETAALGGCDGEGLGVDAGRGTFTKEYMSAALREGWADFVTIWTWNARTENDCTRQQVSGFIDFDLDGDDDNNEANDDYDHMYDCHGTPFVHHDTALPMDNTNWLDDLQDTAYAHHCDREPDDDVEANRSTVYDVAKMFWQLNHTSGQNVPIENLVDLYVDMCPRRWATNDIQARDTAEGDLLYVDDDLPLERLKISAAANGLTTELNAVLDHVEH